jgi:hypothetical protein
VAAGFALVVLPNTVVGRYSATYCAGSPASTTVTEGPIQLTTLSCTRLSEPTLNERLLKIHALIEIPQRRSGIGINFGGIRRRNAVIAGEKACSGDLYQGSYRCQK